MLAQNPLTLDRAVEVATQEVNDKLTKQIAQIRLVDRADGDQQQLRVSKGQIAQVAPTRHYWRQPKSLPLCMHPPGTVTFQRKGPLPSFIKQRNPGEPNARYCMDFGAGRARTYRGARRGDCQGDRRPGEDYPRAIPLARGSPAAEERTQYGQGFPPPGRHLNNENAPFKEQKKRRPGVWVVRRKF